MHCSAVNKRTISAREKSGRAAPALVCSYRDRLFWMENSRTNEPAILVSVVEAEVTAAAESNNRIVVRISATTSFSITSQHPLGYFYGKWRKGILVCWRTSTFFHIISLHIDKARQAMYISPNIEARSCNHCFSGKAVSTTNCECVCSFRYPACNVHAPYFHLWLSGSTLSHHIITLSHKQHDFRKKGYWIYCAYCDFVYNFYMKTFLILRSNEWGMIKMYTGLHVKHPLFLKLPT